MIKRIDVYQTLDDLIVGSILPIAQRYNYTAQSLEDRSRWKPIVLVIGNYSSGKSTFINELVGGTIQRTGQAPTDDCFTILVGSEGENGEAIRVVEELPGSALVNDASMPFRSFKKFGSRFVSHFLMKRINSPRLANLAVIDSPGMLDSVTERDRGYDYQEVVGRLAELADLVVLIFDPHRAGTIKETYDSIRSTLPEATSEDRVVFVLNRIDECGNVIDLVRCYGVLCWNLSQMTGRKDIPRIFLTFSPSRGEAPAAFTELVGERDELIAKVEQAPRLQVSHQLGVVDNHLHKLEMIARTLANATSELRRAEFGFWRNLVVGTAAATLVIDQIVAWMLGVGANGILGRLFTGNVTILSLVFPTMVAAALLVGGSVYFRRGWLPQKKGRIKARIEGLAAPANRYERDLWDRLQPKILELLENPASWRFWSPHRTHANRLRRMIDVDMRRLYDQHLGAEAAGD